MGLKLIWERGRSQVEKQGQGLTRDVSIYSKYLKIRYLNQNDRGSKRRLAGMIKVLLNLEQLRAGGDPTGATRSDPDALGQWLILRKESEP